MSLVATTIYRLKHIEIDASRGCVKRNGQERYLRQQTFQVLLYLLGQRQRLVTKEELIESIWQETSVTDNALVQCIVDIRKALGDDPRHPRYIKTIPKVGYRFIGLVEEHRAIDHQHAEITLPQVPGKKALAVMYFENQSESRELDWLREGLADMLITGLAHSNKLTVLSRQQLYLLLERIGYKPTNKIRLDDALDIARRSHAESVVLGSFAALGEQVRIDVQLYDTADGLLIAADRLVVDTPSEILTRIDLLSLKLAAHLGVPPTDTDEKTGLAEVMTNDLEAYRYYSLGLEKAQAFENRQAIKLLEKAVEQDPQFAMAYARIGYAYAVTDFLPEKGRPYLEKAFQFSEGLTDKDKLYITAWYAIARKDYPSAVRTFRQIISQYPLETEAYSRLGRLLNGEEQAEEALKIFKQGLTVDPDAKDLYNGIGMVYLGLARYDEAIAAHQRYVALVPEEPNAHDSLGMSYQQSGRYREAIVEYQAALELNPEFEPATIHLGDIYFQQGRYREAVRQYQRYIQITRSDLARALGYSNIAHVYWRKGDLDKAEQAAMKEVRYEKWAVWNSLVIALERNNLSRVEKLKEKLFGRLPYPQRGARHDLRSYDYFRGYLALKSGQSAQALAHFKEALKHMPPSSGIDSYEDCLANAYLELGQLDEAINEYERVLGLNPNYPLAHYHLGLAYERKGECDLARAAYERFLQIWKNADRDIPEVVIAKKQVSA